VRTGEFCDGLHHLRWLASRTQADRERELRSVRYLADLQARGRKLREEREAAERAAGTFVPQSSGSDSDGNDGKDDDNDDDDMPALAPADDAGDADDADAAEPTAAASVKAAAGRGVGSGAPAVAGSTTFVTDGARDAGGMDELDRDADGVPALEAVDAAELARVIHASAAAAATDAAAITGPRASDMALFADADADEVVAGGAAAAAAAAPVQKQAAPQQPEPEFLRPTRLGITELHSDEDGSEPEDIPEEIAPAAGRSAWYSVGAAAAPAVAAVKGRPIIEMIGGDDMNTLD
jgi:hypothetical protein